MNAGEARAEMMACVSALREQLAGSDPGHRAALAAEARRQVERVRKRFKRRIDEQASRRFGFSIQGIERKLAEVTAEALAAVDAATGGPVEPGAAPDPARKAGPGR